MFSFPPRKPVTSPYLPLIVSLCIFAQTKHRILLTVPDENGEQTRQLHFFLLNLVCDVDERGNDERRRWSIRGIDTKPSSATSHSLLRHSSFGREFPTAEITRYNSPLPSWSIREYLLRTGSNLEPRNWRTPGSRGEFVISSGLYFP